MSDEPFITGPKQAILLILHLDLRLNGICPVWQQYCHTESGLSGCRAGRIMQRRFIKLHRSPRRHRKGFYLCGIEFSPFKLLQGRYQQDHIVRSNIQLTVPVVLQTVQQMVIAVAITKLGRHAAVKALRQLPKNREAFQGRISGNINGSF